MQTSGLILDMHDDVRGEVVRAIYPTLESVPETVKTAQKLAHEDLDGLPDDVFALVLRQGDATLRKYACIDEGNTVLNVEYFLKTAHKLPPEAAKLAANNLLTACSWYEIDPPDELKKVAFLAQAGGLALKGVGLLSKVQTGLQGGKAALDAGKGLSNTSSMIQGLGHLGAASDKMAAAMRKHADLTNTETMPAASSADRTPETKKAVITKTGELARQVTRHHGDAHYPQVNAPIAQEPSINAEKDWDMQLTTGQPSGRQFHGRVMTPNIEVAGKDGPDKPVFEKKAAKHALREQYPLDNILQIKRASAYFDEFGCRLEPFERHEYCINMVKAAESVGVAVSDEAAKYGSTKYASADEMKVAMDVRKRALLDEHHHHILDQLYEKRATVSPDVFCNALAHFDRMTGLHHYYDQYVPDPFWSTYGATKTAEFMETIGNDNITEGQLKTLMSPGSGSGGAWQLLRKTFGDDFTDEFHKDPVGIFKSLPRDQKIYIMRLATDNAPSGICS